MPMESLQNHFSGIEEKCGLNFFFFLLALPSFPLPGDSKHFQCYMAVAVLLVVQCSFLKYIGLT